MFKYKIKNVLKFYIFTQITSDTYFIFSYTIILSLISRTFPIFNIITFNQSCFSHYNILQDVHLKINEIDMFRTWDIYWWFIFYMENITHNHNKIQYYQ